MVMDTTFTGAFSDSCILIVGFDSLDWATGIVTPLLSFAKSAGENTTVSGWTVIMPGLSTAAWFIPSVFVQANKTAHTIL